MSSSGTHEHFHMTAQDFIFFCGAAKNNNVSRPPSRTLLQPDAGISFVTASCQLTLLTMLNITRSI
jgi:hypothetical protein